VCLILDPTATIGRPRKGNKRPSSHHFSDKEIVAVEVDPLRQIADTDKDNNHFPREIQRSRVELYKSESSQRDLMADMLVKLKSEETGEEPEPGNDLPLEATDTE